MAQDMTTPRSSVIEAAGGVLWRASRRAQAPEVALVHRPKYDDWSLPKGKLLAGEHPIVAAVREVREETGVTAAPGRPLGELRYRADGRPKRVRYWSMHAVSGEFSPHDEVDEVMWLPGREALVHLSAHRDRRILETFVCDQRETWPLILLRHASAGSRERWHGEDRERPLDELGHKQAQALVSVLGAYRIEEVVSADVLRCLDTVGPFAASRGLTVDSEPLVSEVGYHWHPEAAAERFVELVSTARPVVVCSQQGPIPGLVERLCRRLTVSVLDDLDRTTPKSASLVVHLAQNSPVTVVAVEQLEPPATAG